MATLTNILSDYNMSGPSRGGVASLRPRLADIMLSETLQPMNLFMQFSSAFQFKTTTVAGGDAAVVPLWNGTADVTGATEGLATFNFTPGFTDPLGSPGDAIIPIIILETPTANSFVTIDSWTESNNKVTDCTITTSSAGAVATMSGWALFIGARKDLWDFGSSAAFASDLVPSDFVKALHGGVQT